MKVTKDRIGRVGRGHRRFGKRRSRHARELLPIMIAALACAAAIAACGSSRASGPRSGRSARAQFVAFSECMRLHEVPGFPDPAASGGGGSVVALGAGMNPRSPAFQTAMQTCRHLLPGGGAPPESPAHRARDLRFAGCMRAHGVPDYPDPIFTTATGLQPQTPLPSSINPDSPAFKTAQAACAYTGGG